MRAGLRTTQRIRATGRTHFSQGADGQRVVELVEDFGGFLRDTNILKDVLGLLSLLVIDGRRRLVIAIIQRFARLEASETRVFGHLHVENGEVCLITDFGCKQAAGDNARHCV